MSMATLERAILVGAKIAFNNSKLRIRTFRSGLRATLNHMTEKSWFASLTPECTSL